MIRGLPLITYAPRGGGGVNTDAYKCVQGGRGGLNRTKNTHFVRSRVFPKDKIIAGCSVFIAGHIAMAGLLF